MFGLPELPFGIPTFSLPALEGNECPFPDAGLVPIREAAPETGWEPGLLAPLDEGFVARRAGDFEPGLIKPPFAAPGAGVFPFCEIDFAP